MKRNRSIRTLPLDNLNLLKYRVPESPSTYNHESVCFGDEISPIFDKNAPLPSDDSDIILTSVRDLDNSNSKSSSGSLSWGEEYKSEVSKKVRDELERMDRVLRGLEPIPDNYDKEEYEEWMELFPNLCVLGTKIVTYAEVAEKSSPKPEEIIAIDPEDLCDTVEINDQTNNFEMDHGCDKFASDLPKVTVNGALDIDSFLKVSPLRTSRLPLRQSSSRSLISSQISSSKWLKDEDYDSLPFLVGVRTGKGTPKGILKNSLVLPPIEASQFRSISATPRRGSQSLSALSIKDQKYSGFKRKAGKDLCK